jgi:hypothetical protein
MLNKGKEQVDGLGTYIDGKMKRYSLLFSVNGGAFVIAKLLTGHNGRNNDHNTLILGSLTLPEVAVGVILFTLLIWIDVWSWGHNMKKLIGDNLAFTWMGKAILTGITTLLILAWAQAALVNNNSAIRTVLISAALAICFVLWIELREWLKPLFIARLEKFIKGTGKQK